jgi:hypothetical protein
MSQVLQQTMIMSSSDAQGTARPCKALLQAVLLLKKGDKDGAIGGKDTFAANCTHHKSLHMR